MGSEEWLVRIKCKDIKNNPYITIGAPLDVFTTE